MQEMINSRGRRKSFIPELRTSRLVGAPWGVGLRMESGMGEVN